METCYRCGGRGKLTKTATGELFDCPYCDGTGKYIPVAEPADQDPYRWDTDVIHACAYSQGRHTKDINFQR